MLASLRAGLGRGARPSVRPSNVRTGKPGGAQPTATRCASREAAARCFPLRARAPMTLPCALAHSVRLCATRLLLLLLSVPGGGGGGMADNMGASLASWPRLTAAAAADGPTRGEQQRLSGADGRPILSAINVGPTAAAVSPSARGRHVERRKSNDCNGLAFCQRVAATSAPPSRFVADHWPAREGPLRATHSVHEQARASVETSLASASE